MGSTILKVVFRLQCACVCHVQPFRIRPLCLTTTLVFTQWEWSPAADGVEHRMVVNARGF